MVDNLVLFDEDATDFGTLGIGELPDPQSATVHEERNGEFTLTFEYPITGKRFGEIKLGRIVTAPSNPFSTHAQPFRIAKISKPLSGIVTVECDHLSYDLSKVAMMPLNATTAGQALADIETMSVGDVSGWSFGTDVETQATLDMTAPRSARAFLGGQDGSILDVFGGEYEFDVRAVHLWNARGRNRGVVVEYGKNLIDLRQEENNADVYTRILPYWTSTEGDSVLISQTNPTLDTGLVGRDRVLTVDITDMIELEPDETPTGQQVKSAGLQYIDAHNLTEPEVNIEVDFAELAKASGYENVAPLEEVRLCDIVTVKFPELGVDATAKVITTDYDVCARRYSKIEIGSARSNLAATIADMPRQIDKSSRETKSVMQRAIDTATNALTGIAGGHVVIWNHVTHEADNPDEILIMDTADILTARNVWRYNQAGWGFSSTGYNGPFTLAATIGGGIVADAITTGTLDASRVNVSNLMRLGDSTVYIDITGSSIKFCFSEGSTYVERGEIDMNTFRLLNYSLTRESDGHGWQMSFDGYDKGWRISIPETNAGGQINRQFLVQGYNILNNLRVIDTTLESGTWACCKLERVAVNGKYRWLLTEGASHDDFPPID